MLNFRIPSHSHEVKIKGHFMFETFVKSAPSVVTDFVFVTRQVVLVNCRRERAYALSLLQLRPRAAMTPINTRVRNPKHAVQLLLLRSYLVFLALAWFAAMMLGMFR